MAEKASDLASSKGKKKRSCSMEFKKKVVVYAEANSNRSAASHFDVEPKRVKEWKKDFEKIKSTKSNRQRLDGGGRKCIDEDLEEDLMQKTKILPPKIHLLLVVDGVRSLCEDTGSLFEE